MKNEEVWAEYEKLEPEFSIIQAVIDARKASNMTQKELSENTGIASRIYPSLKPAAATPPLPCSNAWLTVWV